MASVSDALRTAISPEELTALDTALAQAAEEGVATIVSGAIPLGTSTIAMSVTGTVAYTLADGTRVGQKKDFICTVAASTPDGVLTPANFVDGATLGFNAVGESATLVWTAAGWLVTAINGATVA